MWRSPKPRFDVASAICLGGRDYQEDAIVTDFPFGTDTGVVVLADGMGGHAAGDVASKLIVTEVFSELKFQSANFVQQERHIPDLMGKAASDANSSVRDYIRSNPKTRGMGATLVSLILVENRMFWLSIGDSPLYHLRSGKLQQLNEDHSMAPQIDFMAKQGLIDEEAAKNHPDRNCLTSVLIGENVARTDCPRTPFELRVGDIVVVSSDGLQYLEEAKIQKILQRYRRRSSAEIAGYLLEAIEALADPDQDNVSLAVIKLNHNTPMERVIAPKPVDAVTDHGAKVTRVVSLDTAKKTDEVANTVSGPTDQIVSAKSGGEENVLKVVAGGK
ncbi:PP2C family protein-serine/threonine phosphatase [Marivita hallyeonensis]|uniref:Serine/threonine protein phosphatase PrpC n=1 Tax=Marivita hallyeonensis TaxID=996342 RepID=A0A1M5LR76_9RHOB|nr:protein phosphatase 2C domain-containing protein [Marivita hallyeonensis]SHG67486.1 Serine/threonine protein phosphatase PrpC [Marivita hallyeonensis]